MILVRVELQLFDQLLGVIFRKTLELRIAEEAIEVTPEEAHKELLLPEVEALSLDAIEDIRNLTFYHMNSRTYHCRASPQAAA